MVEMPGRNPITVVTIDDHLLIRKGIRSLLDPYADIVLVGEGGCGEEIEPLVAKHRPDVLLLDIGLPSQPGGTVSEPGERYAVVPAIHRLVAAHPETRILVVSQYGDEILVQMVVAAGVWGYLLKDDALTVSLVDAIRAVHGEEVYLSERVAESLKAKSMDRLLGQRQLEILTVLATNPERSRAELAAVLSISPHTLTHHIRVIFQALGVNSLAAALLVAVQKGLVPRYLVEPQMGPDSLREGDA